MNVVILAAGIGSRMGEMSKRIPKSMIEINGSTLISRLIRSLQTIENINIIVVSGHLSDKLEMHLKDQGLRVQIVTNVHYKQTNNMFSLSLAKKVMEDNRPLLTVNADCLYGDSYFKTIASTTSDTAFCSDTEFTDEAMKVLTDEEYRAVTLSKNIPNGPNVRTCADMYYFTNESCKKLFSMIELYLQANELNYWLEVAIDRLLKTKSINIHTSVIEDKWYEIDTPDDLKEAKKIFDVD